MYCDIYSSFFFVTKNLKLALTPFYLSIPRRAIERRPLFFHTLDINALSVYNSKEKPNLHYNIQVCDRICHSLQ